MEGNQKTEEAHDVGLKIKAIMGGKDTEVYMVMNRFAVVHYYGFLAPEVLQPIIQSVCGDFTAVLLHNIERADVSRAINCMVVAVNGKRVNPIDPLQNLYTSVS